MLTRPGSKPGPSWMRSVSEPMAHPDRIHKIMMPFWTFFIIYLLACVGITHLVTAVALSRDYVYESSTHIAGLPLVSYSPAAHGVIALGVRATGVIAVGALASGFVAIGGVALGVISIGGVSLGSQSAGGPSGAWPSAARHSPLSRLGATRTPALALHMARWKQAAAKRNI